MQCKKIFLRKKEIGARRQQNTRPICMNSMSIIKSTSIVLPPLYHPKELPYFM
jgi:hypothetical protein